MTTVERSEAQASRLATAPDPLAIARRLSAAGSPGLALLYDADSRATGRCSYVCALPDARSRALDPARDEPGSWLGGTWARVPRWVGVVPYEARRELERVRWRRREDRQPPWIGAPCWLRYPAVVRIDHDRGEVMVVGERAAGRQQLLAALSVASSESVATPDIELAPLPPPAEHLERVARARELIAAGDLYQVNLARRIDLVLHRGAALDLFERMITLAPCGFGALIELDSDVTVISTSPELLLAAEIVRGEPVGAPHFGRLRTIPIKGTRPRGRDAVHDRALANELDADSKERAELAMIVDVERNDLSRVCEVGSVRIARAARVVTHRTVHHRQTEIVGWVRPEMSRQRVLEAMIPSGSVTGAPKVRAMEVIGRLEPHRRGLYTGGLGYLAMDGSLKLAMAIRTLVLRGRQGRYFTGGGIVLGSQPEAELRETEWKARQLLGA